MPNGTERSAPSDRINLRHDDTREVHLEAPKEDRFIMPAAHAVMACQMASQFQQAIEQCRESSEALAQRIRTWSAAWPHVLRVVTGIRNPWEGGIILILTDLSEPDADFDDAVSDLDGTIFREYPHLRTKVVTSNARRAGNLAAYFDPASVSEVYAKPSRAEGQG